MALTGRIIASIYRINQYDVPGATMGLPVNLPSSLCFVEAVPPDAPVTAHGIAMASIIKAAPTGLNQRGINYYSDSTPAQIQSNGV